MIAAVMSILRPTVNILAGQIPDLSQRLISFQGDYIDLKKLALMLALLITIVALAKIIFSSKRD